MNNQQTVTQVKQPDIIVIGAGIVGTCAAVHLQQRGLQVTLIDQQTPGEGTSFGNAGLIERSSVIPYAFPRKLQNLLGYALNQRSDVRYQWSFLPKIAPWLWRYWNNSAPKPLTRAAQSMLPLIEQCVKEHDALLGQANATNLVNAKGWMSIFIDQQLFEEAKAAMRGLAIYHLNDEVLNRDALLEREPYLSERVVGAIHHLDPKTVTDPSLLTKKYAELFQQLGGDLQQHHVKSIEQQLGQWIIHTDQGDITAPQVVIALGADSAEMIRPLGYNVPLAIKRGYHMHYEVKGDAVLHRPICETDHGFVLAPMTRGIRMTTGVEFASDDTPANDIQITQTEKVARTLFPLGERIDKTPWLGRRPMLPDMCPIIGKAPNHSGLWFDFGHGHHGLTLGPVSGKLLAQMMTGEPLLTDPMPYRIERFMGTN